MRAQTFVRAALGAVLAALPFAAWADPVSLIALAANFAAAYGVIATTTAVWIAIGAAVIGTVDARRRARKAQAAARRDANASLEDRSVTVLTADPPWRIVYGRAITGGDIVAILSSDKTATRTDGSSYTKPDAYKHLVVHIASHQCQAINEIYIDGIALGTLDGNGWVTTGEFAPTRTEAREITIAAGASSVQGSAVTVATAWDEALSYNNGSDYVMVPGTYTLTAGNTTINNTGANPIRVTFELSVAQPSVRVQKHLGTASQAVDTMLNTLLPGEWNANDRLRGLTYVVLTLDLEEQRFQGGPPSNLTFDVSGRLVLDTRTSTTAWSSNVALCVRDWLTSEWGYNCLAADVDTTYCNAAANACDALISLTVGGTTTTNQPTYTCNGVFTTADSREAVLEDLCEAMAGFATYGAQWLIQAGAWTASVMDLGDDDLHGQIEIVQGGAGMDEIFNSVRGSYIPAGSVVASDFDLYQNATFLAADGQALYTDRTLPFTDNKARCRNLARIFTEINRDSLVIRYPAKLKAWPLQIGDRVRVSSTEYGWSLKNYKVTDWQFGLGAPVTLLMQEDIATNYDLADAATADPAANSGLPNPNVVATPSSVSASSGTAELLLQGDGTVTTRVRVSWAAIADAYVADGSGQVEVTWRRQLFDSANAWQTVIVPGNEIRAYILGAVEGDYITIGVRAVNGLGVKSNWTFLSHAVVGKTAAPVNVAGLTATAIAGAIRISWTPNTELDYATTELRRGASWAAGVRVDTGGSGSTEVAGNAYDWSWPAVGSYTILARHRDSSGNLSTSTASIGVTVTDTNISVDWAQLMGRPMVFRVVAKGYSDTGAPVGPNLYNGETGAAVFGATVTRSYMMARIRRSDGVVTFSRQYDVFGVGASGGYTAADLATDLNASGTDVIVVVFTYDEPSGHRLDSGLPAALYRCGASRAVFGSPQFKGRSAYLLVGIGSCGEGNGYEAYSGSVDNDTTAWCDASFQLFNGLLTVTGASATPRTLLDYSYTGDLNATQDLVLVAHGTGTVSISGNNVTKTSATGGSMDCGVYSKDAFTGGAYMSVIAMTGTSTNNPVAGLNTDPATDADYISIDYAIHWSSASNGIFAFESGTLIGSLGTWAQGDVLSVVYDGARVYYLQNGTVLRTVSAPAGLKLYLDSGIGSQGDVLRGLRFGPMSAVTGIDTGQLAANAATIPITALYDGPTTQTGIGTTAFASANLATASWTNSTGQNQQVQLETGATVVLNNATTTVGQVVWNVTNPSQPDPSRTIAFSNAYNAAIPVGGSYLTQVTVLAGQTLSCHLNVIGLGTGASTGSITWFSLFNRITVIKR